MAVRLNGACEWAAMVDRQREWDDATPGRSIAIPVDLPAVPPPPSRRTCVSERPAPTLEAPSARPLRFVESLGLNQPMDWFPSEAQSKRCSRGHPLAGKNLCIRKNGSRECRRCSLDLPANARKYHA